MLISDSGRQDAEGNEEQQGTTGDRGRGTGDKGQGTGTRIPTPEPRACLLPPKSMFILSYVALFLQGAADVLSLQMPAAPPQPKAR